MGIVSRAPAPASAASSSCCRLFPRFALFAVKQRLHAKISYCGVLGFGLAASMATGALAGSVTTPGSYADLGTLGEQAPTPAASAPTRRCRGPGLDDQRRAWATPSVDGDHQYHGRSRHLGGMDSAANGVSADGTIVVGGPTPPTMSHGVPSAGRRRPTPWSTSVPLGAHTPMQTPSTPTAPSSLAQPTRPTTPPSTPSAGRRQPTP